MATLKIRLDEETYTALLTDAGRHLRPTEWHAKAILRQALGLPFPYLTEPAGTSVNPSQEHAACASV
jgi:plasmid stability protein